MSLSPEGLYQRGIAHVKEAIALDSRGRLQQAVAKYMVALETLIVAVKYDRVPPRRSIMQRKVAEYLQRAEHLKAILIGAHAASQAQAVASSNATEAYLATPEELAKTKSGFSTIAGMDAAKHALSEAVILPMKFPSLFTGKRQPWKGVLLYGPPGTGKTLVVQALAEEAGAKLISLSASDLVSKYQGDSAKAIKAVFEKARQHGKANKRCVLFVDEVDSIGRTRTQGENESTRQLKTELLRQLDGVNARSNDGVCFVGATNAPMSLDSALRRRFEKRVFVPLPDAEGRREALALELADVGAINMGEGEGQEKRERERLVSGTEGMSYADIALGCQEAFMEPVRQCVKATHFKRVRNSTPQDGRTHVMVPCGAWDWGSKKMTIWDVEPGSLQAPEVSAAHVRAAFASRKPTVSARDLAEHEEFRQKFGSLESTTKYASTSMRVDQAVKGAAAHWKQRTWGEGVKGKAKETGEEAGSSHGEGSNKSGVLASAMAGMRQWLEGHMDPAVYDDPPSTSSSSISSSSSSSSKKLQKQQQKARRGSGSGGSTKKRAVAS